MVCGPRWSKGVEFMFRRLAMLALVGLVASAWLSGCASGVPPAAQKSADTGPVFYPPAPAKPRIQHLASFQGEDDFDAERSTLAKFVAGDGRRQSLVTLYGVAIAGGVIHAVDSKLATVARFDLAQRKYSTFGGHGAGRLKLPINITVDADGTRYITDTGRNEILRYDASDRYLGAVSEISGMRPVDVAISGERLYVTDIQAHQVQVLDKRSGNRLFAFGGKGTGPGQLFQPTNLTIASNGDVLVVDTGNYRVQRFDAKGAFLRSFGKVGDSFGEFARPKGIAVDRMGRTYVADAAFQNVQLFDEQGQLLTVFGQPANAPGLSLPAAVKIDYDHVDHFRRLADPRFKVEYLVLVTSQLAPSKVDVFGFGAMVEGPDSKR